MNRAGRNADQLSRDTEPVARELAPAGLRSRPICWGRCAARREQAPSPQVNQRWSIP